MKAATGHNPPSEYISHHLQNLQVCKNEAGDWVWNECAGNFWTINVDSMFWSVFSGSSCSFSCSVPSPRRRQTDKPGKFQAAID